jgi:O-antigen/teichoic acid export membrane protein
VYSAALRICGVLGFLPLAFVGSVLPAMSRYHEAGETALWRTRYGQTLRYLFILIAPMSVVFTLFPDRTIALLYGPSFRASGPILLALSWMLVFSFLNHGAMIALSSMDREKSFVLIQVAGTALNLAAAVPLILKWEGLGLALSQLAGQAFIFAAGAVRLSRWASVRDHLLALWKPSAAALLLGLVLWMLRGLPFAALLAVSAAAYPVLLLAIRAFSPKEIRAMRDLARPPRNTPEDIGHAPLVD